MTTDKEFSLLTIFSKKNKEYYITESLSDTIRTKGSAYCIMFVDEIAGNASKKRQEQAKARRRKLKEEQKKQNEKKDASTPARNPTHEAKPATSEISCTSNSISLQIETVKNADPSKVSGKSDAVKKALEERRVRSIGKMSVSSATTIQAAYRTYASNKRLVKKHKEVLQKRVEDLVTLTQLLAKQNKSYCPPPSLVNLMLNQMLFVMHSTSRFQLVKNDVNGLMEKRFFSKISTSFGRTECKTVARLVEYAILPGLLTDDNHLDPALVWLESKHGQLTLLRLIRLCLHLTTVRKNGGSKRNQVQHAVAPFLASAEDLKAIYKMLEVLLVDGKECAKREVVNFCHHHLLPPKSVAAPKPFVLGKNPIQLENLDLFQFIRSFLLFPSGKKVIVVPPNAEHERRQCISKPDRLRGDGLFSLVIRIVGLKNNLYLTSKVLSEFLTVPLFTWRIEQKTIDILVGKGRVEKKNQAPPFVSFVTAFIKCHQVDDLNDIQNILPSHLLTICPSPSVLSLCANMVQLGTSCPSINGVDKSIFNFDVATLFFNFMSLLVEKVPLGAFSSRESEMGWIKKGSILSPIILSVVVRDQCKTLLLESFIREVFNVAADPEAFGTEYVLNKKNGKDIKLEKELSDIKSHSATAVAAREAKIDRSTGFWKKSKWAKKLSSFLGGDQSKSSKVVGKIGKGALLNTSAVSRDLATGQMTSNIEASGEKADIKLFRAKNVESHVKFAFALTRTYAIIMSRWAGGGRDIIGSSESHSTSKMHALDKADPIITPFLNVLCFSTPFVRTAWALIQSNDSIIADLHDLVDEKKSPTPIRTRKLHASFVNGAICYEENVGSAFLLLFLAAFAHALIVTDDVELHELDSPLPTHHIRRCILLLKSFMYRACCLDPKNVDSNESDHVGLSLISSSAKIMRDLYDRSSRRLLCPPNLWLINDLLEDDIRRCKVYDDYCNLLNSPVLKVCPFLVSFKRRLRLFERITASNRESIQGRNDGHSFRPGIHVHIMRGRVLEDGLIHLNKLGSNLRRRIVVQYVNSAGTSETGLDAGGLFKEFWTDLSNQSFDPNWALFKETEDGCLYPNPSSRAAHGSDSIVLFEFLGRILGKAIYENITIRPQFAHFFLSFLRGDYNFLHMLPDLSTMDRTLYNNLMFLKTYEGDAKDLCLTFAVAKDEFGNNEEIPLIAGGRDKEVTNLNKHRYIGLVAKHYVCDRVKEQSEAFRRGLWDVIEKRWLRIFNEPELQVLISGSTNGSIDVEDLKANAKLTGGYTSFDNQIRRFWRVMLSFNDQQRADLLKFVTSCERPPPLGFASMNPPFTIQRVPISSDSDKLPTASTCFNILKLPTYSSEKVLKEKILYSIQSGSGFELT